MKKILCFFLFLPAVLFGQRYVGGQITDAENGDPVVGASVFLSSTTIGAFTDTEGRYQLKIPEEGAYRLTVAHVAYQPVFTDIEPGKTAVEFNAALHINELKEVTVTKRVRFRQTDINLFWKTILGKNPSPKAIEVANPEAVYYYYNPETQLLKVTCREPLRIVDYETGYQIRYVLNSFTHNYNKNITEWGNQFSFTELRPEDLKQKNKWEKKRLDVYKISLVKFIKSLYNNSLYNNGFVLLSLNRNPDGSNPYQLSLLNPDSILSIKSADNSRTLNVPSNEQVMLVCFGRPVTDKDLNRLQQEQNRKFFNDSGLFMNLLRGDSIRIFPDGTYVNRLLMAPVNSSNTLLGLNMKLPIEYLPGALALPAAEDEDAFDYEGIARRFDAQLRVYPQEKLHLHTDRDRYVPGEKIRFKAYLTDAATLQPATNSRYVYAELIDSNDSLVNRAMIRPENGMYFGYLYLSESIPEGNYTLRAYTRYMENLGDDYFFKKNIRIGNPAFDKKQSSQTASGNRKVERATNDFDVSFFPEGGNLVEGVSCKVAFEALTRNGYSETITGELVDEAGSAITPVETVHAGMGAFSYLPQPGKRYFLKCRNENGLEKQFELPLPDPRACTLTVSRRNNMLTVGIRKPAGYPDTPSYLLGHCRGMVFHFSAIQGIAGHARNDSIEQGIAGQARNDSGAPLSLWRGAGGEGNDITFPEKDLPGGVLQFVLFDAQMHPLSERLVFSKNYDTAKIEFHTDSATYRPRERVAATVSLTDSIGTLLTGNLSVAVTDDKDIAVDSTTTILSSLLLSSELKGYIENPAYYLQNNPESALALDCLMLTHGWRRYSIPEIVQGNYTSPRIPVQTGQEITGRVNSGIHSKPVPGSEVFIRTKGGDFGLATTDGNGAFTYSGFEYPDSTIYFVQAWGKKDNSSIELVLDSVLFPSLTHAPQSSVVEAPATKEESNAFIVKAEQRSRYNSDTREIQLREVEVTARKIERKEEARLQYWANESSDVTIRREEFEKWYPKLVADILYHIPGFSSGVGKPLVLIDGMPADWPPPPKKGETLSPYQFPFERVSVQDVESIDVFQFSSAAAFGVRGANRVISITTRRGIDAVREAERMREGKVHNYAIYSPLGYQKPVEFYSPKYETLEEKQSTIPDYRTTIFWKPDIVVSDTTAADFEFYTSDIPTTYSVVFEGLTGDGKIVRQVKKIRVEF